MLRYIQHALLFAIAVVVIVLDQITKHFIRTTLAPLESFAPIPALSDYFTLIHTQNTGAAFGMLKEAGGIFTVIAILVVGAIVYYYPRIPPGQIGIRVALGLQLGGAIGNLIDRLLYGTVTDFIFFHFGDTPLPGVWDYVRNAPIFNLADLAITSGVIVLALLMWKENAEARKPSAPEPASPHD